MFEKQIFVTTQIADKNSEIMDSYFTLNKILDNLMDYVDIECVMPIFANELHKIAHKAPIDADRFRDYNASYSFRTQYNTIQGQYQDFESPLKGIEYVLGHLADIDNLLAEAKDIATKENNYDYNYFVDEEISHLREYKKQFILLYDKLEKYSQLGNSLQDFDSRCKEFFIMGLEG